MASASALPLSSAQPLAQGAWPVAELPFLCLWTRCAFSGNSQLCSLAVHHSASIWPPALGPAGSCGQSGDTLALTFWAPSSLLWGRQHPAPSNAHQHSKDRSGLLSHRTAPVWEWGWVTKIWDADGRVRLDRFSGSPFHAISALWCQSASMQLTGVHITVGLASSSSKQT